MGFVILQRLDPFFFCVCVCVSVSLSALSTKQPESKLTDTLTSPINIVNKKLV